MTTSISPQPKLQFFDSNGDPLSGGKLYTYAAGTTTPLATYTDYSGGTPNTNPVILDSRGEANVWLGDSMYKMVLKSSADVTIWTVDNLNGPDAITLARLAQPDGSSLIGYVDSGGTPTTVQDRLRAIKGSGGSALVGFLQEGTGAVAYDVQSKLRQVISVKDFGAVGNGVANDTGAIQTAIDSLTGLGGSIYVPRGTYLLDTLIFPADTTIRFYGDGMGATILLMNSPTAPVIKSTRAAPNIRSIGNKFHDFSVKANAAGSAANLSHIAIDAIGFCEVEWDSIEFLSNGAGSCGLMFRTAATPQLTYSQLFSRIKVSSQVGPAHVIQTQDGGLGSLYNTNIITVRDCWVYNNTSMTAAFDLSKTSQYTFMGNECETVEAYHLYAGNQGNITGNWFESMTTAPIRFFNDVANLSSSSNFIAGNYFSGFSGVVTIPSFCDNNILINNTGGSYTVSGGSGVSKVVIGYPTPAAPTLAKILGGAGTLTFVSAVRQSILDGTYQLLYTFAPSGPGTFGFGLTPPSGNSITNISVGAYIGATGDPIVSSLTYPGPSFNIVAPSTATVNLVVYTRSE